MARSLSRDHLALTLAGMLLLTSCSGAVSKPATPPAVNSPAATAAATTAPSEPTASSTPEETQPAFVMPAMQPLDPDSFSNPKLLHEFWPDVQKAASLYKTIRFGTSVTSFTLSPDGRYVAIAGCDVEAGSTDYVGFARCEETGFQSISHAYGFVFDAANGDLVATLPETGEILTIYALGFTSDSEKLFYIVHDKVIQVWDMATSRVEQTITQDGADGVSYELSPDNKWLMVTFDLEPIQIWDLQTLKHVDDLPSYGYPEFTADGRLMAVHEGAYMTVYETGDWRKLSQRAVLPDGANYAMTSDFALIAVCQRFKKSEPILIWDLATVTVRYTVKNPYGECKQLSFTPDGKYLLMFNENGEGPNVWAAPDWKHVSGTGFSTTFIRGDDRYVDFLQYSQDQSLVLVPTAVRLTLYSLPAGKASAQAAVAAPTSEPSAAIQVDAPPMHCEIKVTGAIRLQTQPCADQQARAGLHLGGRMQTELLDSNGLGVIIYVSEYLEQFLKPGTYPIWDITQPVQGNPDAALFYDDLAETLTGPYESYEGTGDLVLTEVGDVLSGTFEFGARNDNHMEVNIEGTFENIPYIHTYPP